MAVYLKAVAPDFMEIAVTDRFDSHVSPATPMAGGDLFDTSAAVRNVRSLYEEAVGSLRSLANQALAAAPGHNDSQLAQDIATLLHNLSGTAAYFGDEAFGTYLRSLEQPTHAAATASSLHPQCRAILAGIDRR